MLLRSIAIIVALTSQADASCLTANTGAGCHTAPRAATPPTAGLGPAPVEIGTILPEGEYTMILNSQWYGLPRPKDGWVYFRIVDDVYRVDFATRKVLERATREASANWP